MSSVTVVPDRHEHLHVGEDVLVARVLVAPDVLLAVDLDVQRVAAGRRRLVGRGEARRSRR